jgi:hypothetical protein
MAGPVPGDPGDALCIIGAGEQAYGTSCVGWQCS